MDKIGFEKNFLVDNKYKTVFSIKSKKGRESYRVKNSEGKTYYLKIFDYAKLNLLDFDGNKNIIEVEILKKISHPNIAKFIDTGEFIHKDKRYGYVALEFISGETLLEKKSREKIITLYDLKNIIIDILNGLSYLHALNDPIIHNAITPDNIMLDLSSTPPKAILVGFGKARYFLQSRKSYDREGLNPYYLAPENFNNIFSPQTDLYSVGAMIYHLLFGIPPWFRSDIPENYTSLKNFTNADELEEKILDERRKSLSFPNIKNVFDFDEAIIPVIKKSLSQDPDKRFQSADDFIKAVNGEIVIGQEEITTSTMQKMSTRIHKSQENKVRGFSAIAGMKELKEKLKNDVIDMIKNPEEYRKHNLSIPNGILLYGPPGCGKTFFAEKFAEEADFNYMKIKCSDIASIYIHGTQGKLREVFEEAKKQAPVVLFFDELDAIVPSRDNIDNVSMRGEVNEFLIQTDNIGSSGVFLIGTTNKPELIDRAVLRAGRLEKWFYIPPPDFEARKILFELYIKDRPHDLEIDFNKLAKITENYVASDIKFIVDEASRLAIKSKKEGKSNYSLITQEYLEYVIKSQKPTVPITELQKYENIRKTFEENVFIETKRTKIGFKKEE